jgi:hypothetical protein
MELDSLIKMKPMTITEQLIEQLQKMDETQQQRLLGFARILSRTPILKGESGTSIVSATGFFETQALDEMEVAIKEVDNLNWQKW